jgi:hypothetical protein
MSDESRSSPPPPPARSPIGAGDTVASSRPGLSALAVTAFVVALAGFCPLMGLPAIVLGFIAHRRISRRPTVLRGRGLALWAIAIGSATSIAWLSVWNHVGTRMLDVLSGRMEVVVATAVDASIVGDAASLRSVLDGPAVDPAEIDAFFADVREAGLATGRVSVVRFEQTETGMTPKIVAAVRILTDDGTRWTGEAGFRLRPPPFRGFSIEDLAAEPRLLSLRLFGPDGRAVRFRFGDRIDETTVEDDSTIPAPAVPESALPQPTP